MKECTNCNVVSEAFSFQKTNPSKLYAWCDGCRKTNVMIGSRATKGYSKEIQEMRKKAVELRCFTHEQATSLRNRYQSGESVKDLASETGRSKNSIYSAIKGYPKSSA